MAPIVVDTFFTITGLLTSIKLLKLLKKYKFALKYEWMFVFCRVLINYIFHVGFQKWPIGYFVAVFASFFAVDAIAGCVDSYDNDIGQIHGQWAILAIYDGPFDREL